MLTEHLLAIWFRSSAASELFYGVLSCTEPVGMQMILTFGPQNKLHWGCPTDFHPSLRKKEEADFMSICKFISTFLNYKCVCSLLSSLNYLQHLPGSLVNNELNKIFNTGSFFLNFNEVQLVDFCGLWFS